MNVLFAPNNSYVMPTIVLLQSLFEAEREPMDIYVIHSDLTTENVRKLESFIEGHGSRMHLCTINPETFGGAHVSAHITKEAYYRLLAQKTLPESVERVLYLDGDLVVTKSLRELYDMSFTDEMGKENFYVVCEGPGVSQRRWNIYDNLGIPHEYRYFNSGVLLINLKLLREQFDPGTFFDFIATRGKMLKYHDQDVLNALFYDRVIYVDWHVYNQTVLHVRDKEEAAMRLQKAVIIHYAGSDKPWKHTYKSYWFDLFWQFAKRAGYRKQYVAIAWKRFWWKIGKRIKRR